MALHDRVTARLLKPQAGEAAGLLKIMANDRRLMVLCELADAGERSVSELESVSGLSQSALSQHLAKMRRHGIVKTRRSAQTIYYSLASREVALVIEVLCRLYPPLVETDVAPGAESLAVG